MMHFLHEHSLLILLSSATLLATVWLYIEKERLGINLMGAILFAIFSTCFGVCAVSLFAKIESIGDPTAVGRMSVYGGMAFMPVFCLIVNKITKKSLADIYDIFTVILISTISFARINCIITGCCKGNPIADTGMRWPTREAELIYYIVFLITIVPSVYKNNSNGLVFPKYMVSYGIFRVICEFFREDLSIVGPVHIAHVWSILAIIIGLSVLIEMQGVRREGRVS